MVRVAFFVAGGVVDKQQPGDDDAADDHEDSGEEFEEKHAMTRGLSPIVCSRTAHSCTVPGHTADRDQTRQIVNEISAIRPR